MGVTIHEIKKKPVPPNAGNKMQSFVGICISWGVGLLKRTEKKRRIFLI